MRLEGDAFIPATQERVWEGLNDPDVLGRAIPGCNAIERTGETEFTSTIVVKVGPVSASFKGKVELADLNPPVSYTLRGRGQGGPAGYAKGTARVSLAPEENGTRLTYEADVEVAGKLASVGGRLIQGVAKKTANDFFSAFSRVLTGEVPEVEAVPAEATSAAKPAALAGHIPVIDRVAWFLVGLAAGIGLTFVSG
ncbi:SRPBCC family protein [Aliiruegeria lutimaris]|uniref:Carbon monoxide dehydrogenase subunit G n=1 Tax=Aliiruegeria lutimaris TaxID=571298 RepID=A0A1G8Q1G8_9RHOB|nr:carbon monoxide dehydrogenase subunit G [Aliiruegeria lutimaris]SDI98582.1 hypothetical protein SAMN04488026_101015 [Aliiruegeria lutimaris]